MSELMFVLVFGALAIVSCGFAVLLKEDSDEV
jgi:hypothetical protein